MGLLLIIIGAIASVMSLKLIVKCSEKIKSPSYSYLVRKVLGHQYNKALTILIVTGLTGSAVTYQIIILRLI